MEPESRITDTSANGLPEWAQIALLLAFVALLILRFWIETWKIGGARQREKNREKEG